MADDGEGGVGRLVAAVAGAAVVGVGAAVLRRSWPRTPDTNPYPEPSGVTERIVPAADGGQLRRLVGGPPDGRPLVLLHGITLRSELWRHQFRLVDDGFRVIAPDLRGHGGSTPGTRPLGLGGHADDLAELLVDLDLRGAILVGHSMGGMTIAHLVDRHPDVVDERVGGLVFVGSSGRSPTPAFLGRVVHRLDPFVQRGPIGGLLDRAGVEHLAGGFAGGAFGPDVEPLDLAFSRWTWADQPSEYYLAQAPSLLGFDLLDVLAERVGVDAPAVPAAAVVVGTHDRLTPPDESDRLGRALGVEPRIVDRAGHMVMLEAPDALESAIRDVHGRARSR